MITLRALDLTVLLTGPDDGMLAAAAHRAPAGWDVTIEEPAAPADLVFEFAASATGVRLRCEGELVAAATRAQVVLDRFEQLLPLEVALRTRRGAVLHAATALTDHGAIVLPGRSGIGKSTLLAALLDAGARYGGDDLVVVNADGSLAPIATPLAPRSPDRRGPRQRTEPHDLGWNPGPPVRAAMVLFLRHARGGGLALRRLNRGEAALALLAEMPAARTAPAQALAASAGLARACPVWKGHRGEAQHTATTLLDCAEAT